MLCQLCGATNPEEQELCVRCGQRLLVVSGGTPLEEETEPDVEEAFSFDEHLLERISVLEETVKRTAETLRLVLDRMRRQERSLQVARAGLLALQEILHQRKVVPREEWGDQWEARFTEQVQAIDRRDCFAAVRDRIAALFSGERRELFLRELEEAEGSFAGLDPARALEALERAWRYDRNNVELAYFLGESYFNDGDGERALPFLQHVLELSPNHYEALAYSGVLLHQRGEDQAAEGPLKKAASLYPEAFLPQLTLGAIHARRGEFAAARSHLETAVRLDPSPQALFLLGSVLYEQGKHGSAINRLTEAVRLDPSFEEAYHLLGLACLERRWHVRALMAFRRAQRLNPRKMRYDDVVRFLSGQGGAPLPEVGAMARQFLARADAKRDRGDSRGALADVRRALQVEPENPTLLLSFALLCLELNRTQELETVVRKVLDLEPEEVLKATACAVWIEGLRAQGRMREGNQIGERLLAEAGSGYTRTIAYYELAANLAELEEHLDLALDYAKRSLEESPEELKQFPLAALGWIHFKRGELDPAIDHLARSLEIVPSAVTLTHLGMALLAAGRDDEAKEALAYARKLDRRDGELGPTLLDLLKDSSNLVRGVRPSRA